MGTAGMLHVLNTSFVKRARGRPLGQDASPHSSISPLASLWRQRSRRRCDSDSTPGTSRRYLVICADAGVTRGYNVAAFQDAGTVWPPRVCYTADFAGVTENPGASWPPTAALIITALAAMLLIGAVGLIMMSEDVSANIWPHKKLGFVEHNNLERPTSWTPSSDIQVHTKILARWKITSTRSGVVGASRATLGSSAPRLQPHNHGPRYAGDDAETTVQDTEPMASAAPRAPETTDKSIVEAENEPIRPGCSAAFHTYCVKVRDEYYYQPAVNACVMTATDSTVVCNHSRNRFASLSSCRKNCVDGAVPAEKCFQTAIFSKCTRRDVLYNWWYFNGSHCQSWNFPLGGCPSLTDADGGEAFGSRHECAQYCGAGAHDRYHRHLQRRCMPPVKEPCTAKQLRFPYFAVGVPKAGSGVFRCVKASGAVLAHHRCPTGVNRFQTKENCAQMCMQGA
ncbi:hypothetical protein HPB50_005079 [Hyalomma asiaticum]|uniref:Uncharacterized protein n=1 Tax=Hyalomma asiaticum TaxID=266040 RepID=A0ACB7SJJ8_HYAAI|nr:hypothetical protein HPB50_005079 [Hyalomma asiaticum]